MVAVGLMVEGQENLTWDRWRRLALVAEELGFESLSRSDHYQSLVGDEPRDALETWTSLAVAATTTKRLRFGPLVCSVTFRHPANVARMTAAIDTLSGGRFVCGLGAGWNEAEHHAFGIRFPDARTRLEMLDEQAEMCKALWAGGPVSFKGKHYWLDNARISPTPVQAPMPLVIGGSGDRLLRIVAKHATEWNTHGKTPEQYRERRTALEDACREVGRNPEAIERSWMGGFIVGSDAADAVDHARRIQGWLTAVAGMHPMDVGPMLRENGWIVGTADEAVEQMQALVKTGVQRFNLQHWALDDVDVLALVARRIIPAL
jgi:F420-dependent oxidoreductase-like protein